CRFFRGRGNHGCARPGTDKRTAMKQLTKRIRASAPAWAYLGVILRGVLLPWCFSVPAWAAELQTARMVDGASWNARSDRSDDDWNVFVAGQDQPVRADQLVYWGQLAENLHHPQLLLVDGSLLVADLLELGPRTFALGTRPNTYTAGSIWNRAELPRGILNALVFQPPTEDEDRDRLLDQLSEPREHDEAWLENGDRLVGEWLGPFTAEELIDSETAWRWKMGSTELEIPRTQVLAIAVAGDGRQAAGQGRGARLGFRDGSRLVADSLVAKEQEVRFRLACGAEIATTPGLAWGELCDVRPVNRSVVYLSDLEPLGYRHVPLFELTWPYGRDRNVLLGRLRTAQGLYEKGLGMHSTSRLAYELPRGAQRLQLELAMDRSAGAGGSVQL